MRLPWPLPFNALHHPGLLLQYSSRQTTTSAIPSDSLSLRACSKPGSEGLRETSGRVASRKSCTGKKDEGRDDRDSPDAFARGRVGAAQSTCPIRRIPLFMTTRSSCRFRQSCKRAARGRCRRNVACVVSASHAPWLSPIRALARQSPPGVHCTPRPARSARSDHRDFAAALVIAGLQGTLVSSYQVGHFRETLLREERANIPREEEGGPVVMNMETRRDACLSRRPCPCSSVGGRWLGRRHLTFFGWEGHVDSGWEVSLPRPLGTQLRRTSSAFSLWLSMQGCLVYLARR